MPVHPSSPADAFVSPPEAAGSDEGLPVLDEAQAWRRLQRLLASCNGRRAVLGLVGAPGAGKTSYAEHLTSRCVDAAVMGLDGFGLSQTALVRMGRIARRGAPDTFDADGYVATLQRLRRDSPTTVWLPQYRRELGDSVAGSVPVRPGTRLVITEGNYLLLPEGPWGVARELCDEVWFVELPDRVRCRRLVARHVQDGYSRAQARARVTVGADADNAALVQDTRERADAVVQLSLAEDELV